MSSTAGLYAGIVMDIWSPSLCVVPGSVTPHGLEYVSEPNTRTGSDYIRLYRDNGVAERTTEPALNGMAVQKKRYLEEVKVYV